MEAAVDPFHPLIRIVERYRHDVHTFGDASSEMVLARAAGYIGRALPSGLYRFLSRWDGADLFRGALRIRAAADLAPASADCRSIVIFADGPAPDEHWAFTSDEDGLDLFGRWQDGRFLPMHTHFERWLHATVRILDEDHHEPATRLRVRLDADPDGAWLLMQEADQILAAGDPDTARARLRRATALDPSLAVAWQRLGETLLGDDDSAARWAYLRALRMMQIPQRWPSAYPLEGGFIQAMSRLFPAGDDGWERELRTLLDERVTDICTPEEQSFVEGAALALSRVLTERGDREAARASLSALEERSRGFSSSDRLSEVILALADLEVDLGHHDDAERHLRAFAGAEGELSGRAQLVLGRLVMMRQEPWAEEVLSSALSTLQQPAHRARCLVLLGERHLRQGILPRAERCLSEALSLARPVHDRPLMASALLGLGDVCRLQEDGAGAEQHYREAREQAEGHPELLQRILLRRGDLYRMMGDLDHAAADYHRSAEAFGALSLPIREGWAWLRLAQLGAAEPADAARLLFKVTDLAAGVAAADTLTGDPGASLGWHLERAAEHARARANAQRARPPLSRSDADRPERRLGAHRAAISACEVPVVAALSGHLDQCARALGLSASRLTNPNLTRYVAAIDLLAAHRSYEAAEAMLRQLLEIRPGGLAGRALVGAMARSPNAALVDGLLEALEDGVDPSSLAAAAEVLGWRREPAAVEVLRRYTEPGSSPLLRKAAIVALGRIGDPAAINDLLPALDEPDLAESAAIALLLLGEWRGIDDQAQALANQRPNTSRTLGEIVGRYGGPTYLLLLIRTAEQEGTASLGALQGLGYLGDPRVVDRLIEATASRDQQRSRVASSALEVLTGHHEPLEESLLRNRWLEWWAENRTHFNEGQRYRHGDLMSPGHLIRRMAHDDALVRRSSYDELVISTGTRLPFDADGPWRVQSAHLDAWRTWWRQQGQETVGRWTFHGELIG
ncbi:MAG: HEAT repeat protein [Myxococcota bacterium]|jgi:HEAT repeat protein